MYLRLILYKNTSQELRVCSSSVVVCHAKNMGSRFQEDQEDQEEENLPFLGLNIFKAG